MGSNLCLRLLRKGFQVNVNNRDLSKSLLLEKKGAKLCNTPKDLADYSDFIITCVTNFEAVTKVFFHKDGVSETENKNVIVSDFIQFLPTNPFIVIKNLKKIIYQ